MSFTPATVVSRGSINVAANLSRAGIKSLIATSSNPFFSFLRDFKALHSSRPKILYLSMEYGLKSSMPIYSGGLGILSGDTLKSAADLGLPIIAAGLLYKDGYFSQSFANNEQKYNPVSWSPSEQDAHDLGIVIQIPIGQENVYFKLWGIIVKGNKGSIPLILLDSAIEENIKTIPAADGKPEEKDYSNYKITQNLYSEKNGALKIKQRIALGIGSRLALKVLGLTPNIQHLNEGHAALAGFFGEQTFFTTHTPVKAGFDTFPQTEMMPLLSGMPEVQEYVKQRGLFGDQVNMAQIACQSAVESGGRINSVSKLHLNTTRDLFSQIMPGIFPENNPALTNVTNGVHHLTWTSAPFQSLYDGFCPSWREDPRELSCLSLENLLKTGMEARFQEALWKAKSAAKKTLISFMNSQLGTDYKEDVLTIGIARRAADYKRLGLLLTDFEWLKGIAERHGPIQIVFAGKAHPKDGPGIKVLQDLRIAINRITNGKVKAIFIDNYDMEKGALMTAGVDIWLNNPQRPLEASGTSGMKVNFNAGVNLSVLDGWWDEASTEASGFSFGIKPSIFLKTRGIDLENTLGFSAVMDANELYWALEKIVPLYYAALARNQAGDFTGPIPVFTQKMINSIGINAAYFNTHRMMLEYCRLYGLNPDQ